MKHLVSSALGALTLFALVVFPASPSLGQQSNTNNDQQTVGSQSATSNSGSEQSGNHIRVGYLSCHVASGWGYVLGAQRKLNCTFSPLNGHPEYYSGTITKVGANIGYLSSAVMLWGVVAPTTDIHHGSLAGNYAGVQANAAAGYGAGVSAVIGGFKHSIELEPVTISGEKGLNIAAGVEDITLHYNGNAPQQRAAR